MIGAISATTAAIIIGATLAVSVGVGVAVGMSNAGSEAADATKYAADRAMEGQKYSSEQQRLASDHEADLLFKTEEADREQTEKFNREERTEEQQMMQMFGMIDDIQVEDAVVVERRGSRSEINVWADYEYPEPISDSEMSFS